MSKKEGEGEGVGEGERRESGRERRFLTCCFGRFSAARLTYMAHHLSLLGNHCQQVSVRYIMHSIFDAIAICIFDVWQFRCSMREQFDVRQESYGCADDMQVSVWSPMHFIFDAKHRMNWF